MLYTKIFELYISIFIGFIMGEDENYVKFRDSVNFKLISMYCIQPSYQSNDKFLIYTHDQCDRGYYNCLWFQKRSSNILGMYYILFEIFFYILYLNSFKYLELQFGRRPSTVPSFELCDSIHFWSKTWTTLASK